MKKNYGFTFTGPIVVGLVAAGLLLMPIFLVGISAFIRITMLMFSPVTSGAIPVWAIFVGGIAVLLIMKMRRQNASSYN